MATKRWPPVTIDVSDWENLQHYSIGSIAGIKLIAALDTPFLQRALMTDSRCHKMLCDRIGPGTNVYWVTTEVAAQLWDRGAIAEGEYHAVRDSILETE